MLDLEQFKERVGASMGQTGLAFPAAEYAERLRRVQAVMARAELDVLLVTHVPDVNWLCGYDTFGTANHVALLVPAQGSPVIQPSSVEIGATLVNSILPPSACVLCDTWYGQAGISEQLARLMEEHGFAGARIGLQPARTGLRADIHQALLAALPQARFADASAVVSRERLVKSPAELACLERAAEITALGIEAALAAVRIGGSDQEISAAAVAATRIAGGDFAAIEPIVSTGRRTSLSHQTHRRQIVGAGDAVFLEFGGNYKRYTAPLMRSAVVGRASAHYLRVAAAVQATLCAVIEAARPGRTGHDVARAAAPHADAAGDDVFFLNTYGYHVGIGYPPTWAEMGGALAEGVEDELRPGMVFHLPIAFRVPGDFGVGVSETIAITESGCRPLGRLDRGIPGLE